MGKMSENEVWDAVACWVKSKDYGNCILIPSGGKEE